MREIFGSFYFRILANGHLSGEYINNDLRVSLRENASRINPEFNGFEGLYSSSWEEIDGNWVDAILQIRGDQQKLFLEWRDGLEDLFFGEGFVVNNMLIGCYSNRNVF